VEYVVLHADSAEELDQLVSEWIAEGYEPQGGVSVTAYEWSEKKGFKEYSFMWAQAMVKRSAKRSSKRKSNK
jgi:hypothetical protein